MHEAVQATSQALLAVRGRLAATGGRWQGMQSIYAISREAGAMSDLRQRQRARVKDLQYGWKGVTSNGHVSELSYDTPGVRLSIPATAQPVVCYLAIVVQCATAHPHVSLCLRAVTRCCSCACGVCMCIATWG